MAKAFILIEKPYPDDDYNTVSVLMDDSRNTLMHEVHDGGCFNLEEYVDDINTIKTGYYNVEYDYHEETESWEMPNIKYPVIDEWDMTRVWFGWIKWYYISIKLFITRQNKYGY